MKDETFLAENGFSVVCTFDFSILPLLDVVSSPLFFYRTTSKKFGHPLNIFLYMLAKNPEKQKILRQEVLSV